MASSGAQLGGFGNGTVGAGGITGFPSEADFKRRVRRRGKGRDNQAIGPLGSNRNFRCQWVLEIAMAAEPGWRQLTVTVAQDPLLHPDAGSDLAIHSW